MRYPTGALNYSDMLQEVILGRNLITDHHSPEFLSRYFHSVGQLPAYIISGDEDRWHLFIYAAEFLRQNPEWKDVGLSELKHRPAEAKPHRVFGKNEEQPELDGTMWGGLDEDDEDKTIKAQMRVKKEADLDRNRKIAKGVPAEYHLTKEGPDMGWIAKWIAAEKTARTPRAEWEGKIPVVYEEMVKYCYGWLKDIGEVPKPYPMDLMNLFWPPEPPGRLYMYPEVIKKRDYVTGKVMSFWRKSMAQPGVKEQMQLDRSPRSYRVILAAKKLSTAIEYYAHPDPIHGEDEKINMANVKKAALKYFQAHFPIEMDGAKAGPLETVDPDYVTYRQLCAKYNLKEGTLLHKANL